MDKYYVPQSLDAPYRIIIWTADELVAFTLPFVCCLSLFNAPIMGLALGTALVLVAKRLKREEGQCFVLYWAYWHLPPLVRYKTVPPSSLRELLG